MTNPRRSKLTSLSSKSSGQYHSAKGTAVEAVGNLTGAQSWQQSGKEEHAAGETEYNAAQAEGYVEGVSDRVGGKFDSVAGAVKGDKQQQASGMRLCSVMLIVCHSDLRRR